MASTGTAARLNRDCLFMPRSPVSQAATTRIRFPVAAKMALQIAGATEGGAGSPSPVGELSDLTNSASIILPSSSPRVRTRVSACWTSD